jgi:hypothetical protein
MMQAVSANRFASRAMTTVTEPIPSARAIPATAARRDAGFAGDGAGAMSSMTTRTAAIFYGS